MVVGDVDHTAECLPGGTSSITLFFAFSCNLHIEPCELVLSTLRRYL